MHAMLEGRDSVVVLPTGGGKSLCFQAPAVVVGPPRRPDVAGRSSRAVREVRLEPDLRRRAAGVRAGRLAAHLADEGSGRRPARRRRGGVVSEQHALTADERDAVMASLREDRCRLLYVSPERLVGEGSPGVPAPAAAGGRALHRHRRGALHQPVGPRFPARSTGSSDGCATTFRTRRSTRSRPRRPSACAATSSPSCGCRTRSCWSDRSIGRTSPIACCGAATCTAAAPDSRAPRGRSRHRLLPVAARSRGARRLAAWRRPSRRAVSRRPARRCPRAGIRRHFSTSARHRRRHGGVRDGHRSIERALRRARRRAAIARALPAGVGPRRPRRSAGRVRADLLRARFRPLAADARGERRVDRQRAGRCCATWSATRRATRCRHRALVEYFGEPYDRRDCGACDWCLKELDPVADSTIVAQKILSCVARVKQTWGIGHVTDVLLGRATEKVRRRRPRRRCRRSGC